MNRLTIRDACAELRCSRWTLDRLFKAGKLHKLTQGRNVYVDAAELKAYISRRDAGGTPFATRAEVDALKARIDELIGAGRVA